ncbi:MAG: SusC/RagA family TonB-linked outer membrane protein [Ichthyobacteriaceae bacterium]|nr:SusC/RagA family TonB-linked outer membrane protein [Ichthyobacteriaceae bacterium]
MRKRFTFYLFFVISFMFSMQVFAQEIEISGVVMSDDEETMPGVSIIVLGTTKGATTDFDGNYTIKASKGETLQYSFIGYANKVVTVEGNTTIDVVLNVDSEILDDVVVTALGISRKEESLGYAVSKVGGSELAEVKSINAVNSLSGKVAGVDIQQGNTGAGGSSKVTIRGNSKITGSNQPLYVIDGVPMDNGSMGQAGQYGGQDLGDGISSINPDDIETMSVLKGPAAAALYGTRASNGVILITTKSWKKGSGTKFNVDFSSNFTVDNIVGQYEDVQYVYGQGIKTPPKDIGDATGMWSWGAKMDPNLEFMSFDGTLRDYGVKEDNIKSFFRTGTSFQNTVSFSGGNEQANFRFSASDVRMNDIVPNSGLHRNSFNLRGTMKMTDKFSLDTKINYTLEDVDNRPYLGFSGANTALALIGLPASFDQSWLENSRVDDAGNYVIWNAASRIINPYFSLYEMANNSKKNRTMGYLALTYDFTDWLNLRVKSGLDTYSYLYYNYSPISTPLAEWGEMRELNARTTETNTEFLLSANKQISDNWNLSGSVGGNIMSYENYTTDVLGKGQVARELLSINNYKEFSLLHQNPRKQINSLYAFANTGYKDFLYFDVTARNDWSSTLPEKNNSYFYPSVTSAFVLTNAFEDLKTNFLSYAKVRGSYAEVGGDTDPYNLSRTYSNYAFQFNSNSLTTEATTVRPNKDLKPSRTKGFEVGLDAKFLNWRVGMDVTYYNQSTFDEIVRLPISSASKYDYAYINAGEINNSGVELMINFVPIKTDDLRWDLTINMARNVNKVVKLHDEAKVQELSRADWIGSYIQAEEGGKYGDIVGYDFKRVEGGQFDGKIIVKGKDETKPEEYSTWGQPIVSDEQQVLGNGQYDFTSGITNTISYKGFTIRALLDMKFGADILSMTNLKLHQYGTHVNTLEGREEWAASEKKRLEGGFTPSEWTPTGGYLVDAVYENGLDAAGNIQYKENKVYVDPRDYYANIANKQIMSPYIYDVSYVKLREMSLSYSFQGDQLKALKYFKGATLSLIGRNIWLIWTNVPNIDPESTYSISNGQGYEYGSLPQRRSYGVNLNLNF